MPDNLTETTITEALAELHTIDKRLDKKREFIAQNTLRNEREKDPFEAQGGSNAVVAQELQAIGDLEGRKISIRRAIKAANDSTQVTVGTTSRTIADWLVWRKEVAPHRRTFLTNTRNGIQGYRAKIRSQGGNVVATGEQTQKGDFIVHLDELALAHELEELEAELETLDGKLSLTNARVTVSY